MNHSDDAPPMIPSVVPLRRPYSPAKSNKRESHHRQDETACDNQNKIFTPPGHNISRQGPRNNNLNNNRGNSVNGRANNNYNRNRPAVDRRPPAKQDSLEDESWENGAPSKQEPNQGAKAIRSPKKTGNPPKNHTNNTKSKTEDLEPSKVTQEESGNTSAGNSLMSRTVLGFKTNKEIKAPGSLTDVTPTKKPLVPKSYLIEQLKINDTVLLSVESAASECGIKRSGFVCLSMHESYQDQYQKLCEDYVFDCEADTAAFAPAIGEVFSYLSPADGGWYRARKVAANRAALLDSCRLVALQSTDKCKKLPSNYEGIPEFACLLNANVKLGENLTCKILAKRNDGFKVHIENIETNIVVGEGEVSRWVPDIEYPATAQKSPVPEVIRPAVSNNSKVLLVDMTESDRVFVRPADPTAMRQFDDLLQNVVLAAANASPLTEPPHQGDTVIGQYTDGLFYRALCKRTNVKQNKYLLEYIDFGNVEITKLEKLYACPEEYQMSSEPTLAARVTIQLPAALTPPAVEFINKLKDSNAELMLTIPSGEKTAPSGSAVNLMVMKNNQSVDRRLEELCTPDWKKFEEKGGDVVDTEPVMYTDLEYLELPARNCEVEVLDISTLQSGTVSGCQLNVKHADFDKLTERMAEYCDSELGKMPYLPKHEELCIAKFPPYPQWFRAVLLEQTPGQPEAEVCYVDYGNVGSVAISSLRKMLPEFVRGHPAVASQLEIKDFPKEPTTEMLARAVEYMKINDEGRGVLRVARCIKQEPGLYVIEVPDLISAMKG